MEKEIKLLMMQTEIVKNSIEFINGEYQLNISSLSREEKIELAHKCAVSIYIHMLASVSSMCDLSCKELHQSYDFDKCFDEFDAFIQGDKTEKENIFVNLLNKLKEKVNEQRNEC